jgi:hypothetical protein
MNPFYAIAVFILTMNISQLLHATEEKANKSTAEKESTKKVPPTKKLEESLLYLDLPEAAQKALNEKVLKSDILQISKFEQADKPFYRVKIRKMDHVGYLYVSENGVFLDANPAHTAKKDQNEKPRLHKEKPNF